MTFFIIKKETMPQAPHVCFIRKVKIKSSKPHFLVLV